MATVGDDARVGGRDTSGNGPSDPAAGDAVPEGDLGRILTVPNLLSFGRLLCIPLFLWLLFGRDNRVAAAFLLLGLGVTDWVDGYIARHFNQVSTLGKVLDPTADRLLVGVGVVAILIDGSVPAWIAWLVIARETLVSLAVVALAALGAKRIDVSLPGKAGTFLLMGAFPAFLLSHAESFALDDFFGFLAWPLALAGLALSWYAAVGYVPAGRQALMEGRAAHAASGGRRR